MFYKFPEIRNISDVLPAIEGASEFLVADRGDHITINYMVNTPTTFPPVKTLNDAIRRELRGIIFSKDDGRILRRPLHKFFNIGEREETQANLIDLSRPHDILEKLDGSFICPYRVNGRIIMGTKMGCTDVADQAERFVEKNPQYIKAFECAESQGFSLIFEWCSRKQRIVLDHPEDTLVLIASRNIVTGNYHSYSSISMFGQMFGIPVVERFATEGKTVNEILEYVRAQEGTEGIVIRFHDGAMLKCKSEWYLKIHNAKDAITEEKNVVQMIIDSTLDDAKSLVLEEDRKNLDRYEGDLWKLVQTYTRRLFNDVVRNRCTFYDRKEFAIEGSQENQYTRTATFRFFDQEAVELQEVQDYVVEKIIRPALSTRTKYGVMKSEVLHGLRQYI
jgi:RNA ligase